MSSRRRRRAPAQEEGLRRGGASRSLRPTRLVEEVSVGDGMETVGEGREEPSAPAASLDDDAIAEVMASLAAKRREWELEHDTRGADFKCVITGGAWCRANLGVDYDGVRARAVGLACEAWCRCHGLRMSSSFAFSSYGEAHGNILASEWCREMLYYSQLLQSKGGSFRGLR